MKKNIEFQDVELTNLGSINVILGKNGVGKSTLLREIYKAETGWGGHGAAVHPNTLYITPERGGLARPDGNVDNQLDSGQLTQHVLSDHYANYRQLSMSRLVDLKVRAIDAHYEHSKGRQPTSRDPDELIAELNGLQDRVDVVFNGKKPSFVTKEERQPVPDGGLSSGEKELLCIGADLLHFELAAEEPKIALVLVDEPDVHIHPDMEARLGQLIARIARDSGIQFIVATHSTAFLAGLADSNQDVRVSFMQRHASKLAFRKVSDEMRRIVPVFGAHPLSNLFNRRALLFVEGPNDEWMWVQATRSNLNIRVNPVPVGGKPMFERFEQLTNEIVGALYDDPKAYSLRDSDGITTDLIDLPHVTRLHFAAHEAENLILSDEVLSENQIAWGDLKGRIEAWIATKPGHQANAALSALVGSNDRAGADIKNAAVVLQVLLGVSLPLPLYLGQAIAKYGTGPFASAAATSVKGMLGQKTCAALLGG